MSSLSAVSETGKILIIPTNSSQPDRYERTSQYESILKAFEEFEIPLHIINDEIKSILRNSLPLYDGKRCVVTLSESAELQQIVSRCLSAANPSN
jgi:hypothetical protein